MQFSFENCKFRIQRSKEGTGRVVVWMMGVANSYTMEASFGGSTLGGRTDTHFTTQDFEAMGRAFCETLLDFSDEDPSKVFGYFNYLTLLKINIPNFVYFPLIYNFQTVKQSNVTNQTTNSNFILMDVSRGSGKKEAPSKSTYAFAGVSRAQNGLKEKFVSSYHSLFYFHKMT